MRSRIVSAVAGCMAWAACATAGERLVIKGSDTIGAELIPPMREAYLAKGNDTTFEIAAEGSTTGITALMEGDDDSCHIAMSSRELSAIERLRAKINGVDIREVTIAYDGIAVVVNAKNPVSGLTRRQVEDIFSGDVADWHAVGGDAGAISIYTRNTSSGTYSGFKWLAMRKRDYAPSAQKMAGNQQVAAEVANNPNGIGYVGLPYAAGDGLKIVTIDGRAPSQETIRDGTYPYSRPLYLYTRGEPRGEPARFIEFVLGPDGQRVVSEHGFVPVAGVWRRAGVGGGHGG
ncbi:MAG: phosphate ABC transporter substrate-binding protein [Verrucomicrobiae bacterium]|nr:phosphate ABC transporter substrate-binding protein [Verrucomicrobiae bacterium]